MTSEVKNYIELSDIIRFRFECRGCKAIIELRLDDVKKGILGQCPMCREGWTSFHGADNVWHDHEQLFIGLAQGIKKAHELSTDGIIGFLLKLEIKTS